MLATLEVKVFLFTLVRPKMFWLCQFFSANHKTLFFHIVIQLPILKQSETALILLKDIWLIWKSCFIYERSFYSHQELEIHPSSLAKAMVTLSRNRLDASVDMNFAKFWKISRRVCHPKLEWWKTKILFVKESTAFKRRITTAI